LSLKVAPAILAAACQFMLANEPAAVYFVLPVENFPGQGNSIA